MSCKPRRDAGHSILCDRRPSMLGREVRHLRLKPVVRKEALAVLLVGSRHLGGFIAAEQGLRCAEVMALHRMCDDGLFTREQRQDGRNVYRLTPAGVELAAKVLGDKDGPA